MPRLVITGCGRSGTQYIAQLLTQIGFKCRHEKIFTPNLDPTTVVDVEHKWEGYEVEVSWMAAPFLNQLPRDILIWHQIRNPLQVVRCFNHNLTLSNQDLAAQFVRKLLPECCEGDELTKAVAYCYRWLTMIHGASVGGHSYQKYLIERLNISTLQDMLRWAGFDAPFTVISKAMSEIRPGVGKCMEEHKEITWDEIKSVRYGKELHHVACCLGYIL